MLKKLFIASTLLLLTACNDPFEGLLSVKHPMNVLSDKKAVHVPAGDSQAQLEFASKQKIVLKLVNAAGVKSKLVLETPGKLSFPSNGQFEFSPAQLNQNFGATGNNQQTVSATPTQSGYQQCQYQRRETVCYPVGNGNVQCRHEYRTVYGRQYVEFHDETTHQDLTVNFVSPAKVVLATFTGHRHYTQRIVHHEGQCW